MSAGTAGAAQPPDRRVGFLGLGPRAAPFAIRLSNAGHGLLVHDPDPDTLRLFLMETGGDPVASPAHLAGTCGIVFVFVEPPELVERMFEGAGGLLQSARPGRIFVDLGRTAPVLARRLARRSESAGAAYLDAPPLGGPEDLRAGTLQLLVGGAETAIEAVRPLLALFTQEMLHTGPAGTAQTARVLGEALAAVQMVAVAEVLAIAVAGGVTPERLLRALGASPGANRLTDLLRRQGLGMELSGPFDPRVLDEAAGDALQLAETLALPAPLTALSRQLTVALRQIFGDWSGRRLFTRLVETVPRAEGSPSRDGGVADRR